MRKCQYPFKYRGLCFLNLLSYSLKRFEHVSLTWLTRMASTGINGTVPISAFSIWHGVCPRLYTLRIYWKIIGMNNTNMHAHMHKCAHMNARTHARTHKHTHTHTHTHARARTHAHTYIRTYIRMHTRTNSHTHKHTQYLFVIIHIKTNVCLFKR